MPVVMSYESVEALGSLAYQAGYANYRVMDQARADAHVANRQQMDVQRQQLEIARQQANADRQLQGRVANQQAAFQQGQLDLAQQQLGFDQYELDQRLATTRAIAGMNAQSDIAQRLIDAQSTQQRDAQLHQYRMTELGARGTRDASGAMITPQGNPTPSRASGRYSSSDT